jgi:ATP-dependent Clp protease adaptor protein ClpS
MDELDLLLKTKLKAKTERPRLYKVILLNDDYTPRDFVVAVLKAVFRMTEGEALGVMLAAHRKGACVVAVYTQRSPRQRQGRPPTWAPARASR